MPLQSLLRLSRGRRRRLVRVRVRVRVTVRVRVRVRVMVRGRVRVSGELDRLVLDAPARRGVRRVGEADLARVLALRR